MSEEIRNEEMIESEQPKEPPRFETRTTYTKKVMQEFYTALASPLRIYWIVFIAVYMAALIADVLMFGGVRNPQLYAYAVVLLACFGFAMATPFIRARRAYRRNILVSNKREPTTCELFHDAKIVSKNELTGGTQTYSYADIRTIRRTKSLYLLGLPMKLYLIVDRNGFVTGDAASFEEFLAEKCPQAKRNFLKGKK